MNCTGWCSTPKGDGASGTAHSPCPSLTLTRRNRRMWCVCTCMHAHMACWSLTWVFGKEEKGKKQPKERACCWGLPEWWCCTLLLLSAYIESRFWQVLGQCCSSHALSMAHRARNPHQQMPKETYLAAEGPGKTAGLRATCSGKAQFSLCLYLLAGQVHAPLQHENITTKQL